MIGDRDWYCAYETGSWKFSGALLNISDEQSRDIFRIGVPLPHGIENLPECYNETSTLTKSHPTLVLEVPLQAKTRN